MLIAGLAICTVVSAIYVFATSWLMLLPAVMLLQVGFKLIVPLADLIFISTSRPSNRAQLMGFSRVIWSISSLLAPAISAMIVTMCGGITVEGIRPLYSIQLLSIVAITFFVILTLEELRTNQYSTEASGASRPIS